VPHGRADQVVGVEKARALERLLRDHGRAVEIESYGRQGQLVQGAGPFDPDVPGARERMPGPLAKHLQRPAAARARWTRRKAARARNYFAGRVPPALEFGGHTSLTAARTRAVP
jgi:hypothetical protein